MTERPTLAVQLYTLRTVPGSFESKLSVVAEAGYEAVETVGDHGLDAEELRAAVDRRGLRITSSHVPLARLRDDPSGSAAFARTVGAETLVVPHLPEAERPIDAAGWRRLGASLGELGAWYARHGVRLAYHNHDFELATVDGRLAIDVLLDAAPAEHLAFEPDLAWIARAGHDPLELLDRHAGRCPLVHVKDLAAAGTAQDEGGWAAVGQGVLAWDALLPAALAAGAEALVVEHDRPAEPERSVRDSFAFLSGHAAVG